MVEDVHPEGCGAASQETCHRRRRVGAVEERDAGRGAPVAAMPGRRLGCRSAGGGPGTVGIPCVRRSVCDACSSCLHDLPCRVAVGGGCCGAWDDVL